MKIVLYSSVKDCSIFQKVGFYRDDISAMQAEGHNVLATNSIKVCLSAHPRLCVCYFYSKAVLVGAIMRFLGREVVFTGGADQISPIVVRNHITLLVRRVVALVALMVADRVLVSCNVDMENFRKICFKMRFLERKLILSRHVVVPVRSTIGKPINRRKEPQFNALTLCWLGSEGNVFRKGVDKAIKLIHLLRKTGVDATLDIAGVDGPGRVIIEQLITKLELKGSVRYLGYISEEKKIEMYSVSSVYLQLSEYEGFGVAAAEAFFSGMIVVHSNRGGLADVIGEKGLILNPEIIESNDMAGVYAFNEQFRNFRVDHNHLSSEISKYSFKRRAIDLTVSLP